MKKLLLLFTLVAITASASAQDPHLKFKGVEIAGSLNNFIIKYKFQNKNAKLLDSDDNKCYYEDLFCGEPGTVVGMSDKNVGVFTVYFLSEEKEYWNGLIYLFDKYYNLLSDKYGQPYKKSKRFLFPYNDGDIEGHEIYAIKNDKCDFYALWKVDNGNIYLTITTGCKVCLSYEDKIGNAKYLANEKTRYQNEL